MKLFYEVTRRKCGAAASPLATISPSFQTLKTFRSSMKDGIRILVLIKYFELHTTSAYYTVGTNSTATPTLGARLSVTWPQLSGT